MPSGWKSARKLSLRTEMSVILQGGIGVLRTDVPRKNRAISTMFRFGMSQVKTRPCRVQAKGKFTS